jgi:hypothetical protein
MLSAQRKDEIEAWKARAISWSQLSSWKYSKDQWAFKYILNKIEEPNAGMVFGNTVGDTLGTSESVVPNLNPFLIGDKEHELHVKMNQYSLIGYCDHYCPKEKVLNENKTSQNLGRWNKKEVDAHGQLTMYALMLLLRDKIQPEDIEMWLNFIPVRMNGAFELELISPDTFYRFPTKRTLQQVLQFGADIDTTIKEMEKYAIALP